MINGVLNDEEFAALKKQAQEAWQEYMRIVAAADPANKAWLELHRKVQREELKREVFAEQIKS